MSEHKVNCRGSIALGTGCKKCERCLKELDSINLRLANKAGNDPGSVQSAEQGSDEAVKNILGQFLTDQAEIPVVPACDQGANEHFLASAYADLVTHLSRVTKERDAAITNCEQVSSKLVDAEKQISELRAELEKARDHIKDLQVRRACIQCFVPQTYGDAILENWLHHGEIEGHEWDNRTSEENIVWMTKRLLAELEKVKQGKRTIEGVAHLNARLCDQANAELKKERLKYEERENWWNEQKERGHKQRDKLIAELEKVKEESKLTENLLRSECAERCTTISELNGKLIAALAALREARVILQQFDYSDLSTDHINEYCRPLNQQVRKWLEKPISTDLKEENS